MPFYFFHWDDELIDHIDQHGVSVGDFQDVVTNSDPRTWVKSRTTGRDIAFGETASGRRIACVFEWIDEDTILPITAYKVE